MPALNRADIKTWRFSADATVIAQRGSPIEGAIDAVFARFAIDRADDLLTAGKAIALELDARPSGALVLRADGRAIVRLAGEASLAPVLEAMLIGLAVRSRADAAALHAADVRIGAHAALLIGAKGSGKSTLAARFTAAAGDDAVYGGDEIAFVSFADHRAESFPKSATLKEGSFSLFATSTTYADPIRGPVRYVSPSRGSEPGAPAKIAVIIFPKYSLDSPEAIDEAIEPHDAAIELVRGSFGGLDRDPRMIELVAGLTELPARRLVFSDSGAAVALLRALIEAHAR